MENDKPIFEKLPCVTCGEEVKHFAILNTDPKCRACKIKEFLKKPKPEWCICDDAYRHRGRYDPQCRHDDLEDMEEEIETLKIALAIKEKHDAFDCITETAGLKIYLQMIVDKAKEALLPDKDYLDLVNALNEIQEIATPDEVDKMLEVKDD